MSSREVLQYLYDEYLLHHRLTIILFMFLLAAHVSMVYFDLQTTYIGISLAGSPAVEVNPLARASIEEDGLRSWYHSRVQYLLWEVIILLSVLLLYVVTPSRRSRLRLITQSLFITAIFYMGVSILVTSVAVSGNLASLRVAIQTLK